MAQLGCQCQRPLGCPPVASKQAAAAQLGFVEAALLLWPASAIATPNPPAQGLGAPQARAPER